MVTQYVKEFIGVVKVFENSDNVIQGCSRYGIALAPDAALASVA
jgi:hypothetical protein